MKKWMFLIFSLASLFSGTVQASDAQVEIGFRRLAQGNIGMITVVGEDIVKVRAAFLDNQYLFPPNDDGEFVGFIGVPMASEPGFHRLSILIFYNDGSQEYVWENIQVLRTRFLRTSISLPVDLKGLLDEDVIYEELALLDAKIKPLSDGANWLQTGLVPPFTKIPSDSFGTIRFFNGDIMQRHTGIDYSISVGTPVAAAADGVVVLSQSLPIRGEYVLVDHGSGLYSGYAHLSERLVEVGDMVQAGDVLGSTGNTGRSTGPHLHWETALGGVWVNPLELTALLAR